MSPTGRTATARYDPAEAFRLAIDTGDLSWDRQND